MRMMIEDGFPASACELNDMGVCVARGACGRLECDACLAVVTAGVEAMRLLPAAMAAAEPTRYFVPIATSPRAVITEASHQRDFRLPLSPCVEAALRAAVAGAAGAVLAEVVGRDAELVELTAIASLPGAAAQAVHSDSTWSGTSSKRQVTVFLALHDVLDERAGPTRFVPETHAPRCFPGGLWLPPNVDRVADRGGTLCFALRGGDAVLMDALLWHGGGANSSASARTLLSFTFEAARDARRTTRTLRLDELRSSRLAPKTAAYAESRAARGRGRYRRRP